MSSAASGRRQIAERYATALFELAGERGERDKCEQDLRALSQAFAECPEFSRLVINPLYSAQQLLQVVNAVLDKIGAGTLTHEFCRLLAEGRRLAALPLIAEKYLARLAESRGEALAHVVSAIPLNTAQIAALSKQLGGELGRKVTLRQQVDPSIMGGLMVRIGSHMLDASVRTKLNRLERALKATPLKVA